MAMDLSLMGGVIALIIRKVILRQVLEGRRVEHCREKGEIGLWGGIDWLEVTGTWSWVGWGFGILPCCFLYWLLSIRFQGGCEFIVGVELVVECLIISI